MAVGCQGKSHRVLGNCFRGIARDTDNLDSAFGRCFQINIVVSCAAHQDQLYTLTVQFFNYRCAKVSIYKCADGIIAVGKSCCFLMDVGFDKFDFNAWIGRKQLLKKFLIVALGVIKQNSHNSCSSLEYYFSGQNNIMALSI